MSFFSKSTNKLNLPKVWLLMVLGLGGFYNTFAQDILELRGGSATAGQQAEFGLYVRDVSGTAINSTGAPAGFYSAGIKVFFDTNLVDSVEFVAAGVTQATAPFLFVDSSREAEGIAQVFMQNGSQPFDFRLDPAAPGDLIATLRLTPSAQADGQTISFTFDAGDATSLANETGTVALTSQAGNLTVQLGSIQVGTTGGNPPSIQSFTASPTTIDQGQASTLSWDVTGADTVSISEGVGNVAVSGNTQVSPTVTTTYTLTATNSFGSRTATATVTVIVGSNDPPVIQSFGVNPGTIVSGNSATLSWDVTDADTVSIDPGIGSVPGRGNRMVNPSSTTTYTLTATNGAGTRSATAKLTVSSEPVPQITRFRVSPVEILEGESATLSWTVTDADAVDINQGIGRVESDDSIQVNPTEDTEYLILASNSAGSNTATVSLRVTQAVQIVSFTANPNEIASGETAELSWNVANANQVILNPGNQTVQPQGTMVVSPTATTTYTLRAEGPSNQVQEAMALVTVSGDPGLRLSQSTVDFGNNDDTSSFVLSASGGSSASWRVSGLPSWLVLSATAGTLQPGQNFNINAAIRRDRLVPGQTGRATLTFSADGLESFDLAVSGRRAEVAGERYLYFPLVTASDSQQTELTAWNLSDQTVAATLLILNQNGELVGDPIRDVLAAKASLSHTVNNLGSMTSQGWAVATLKEEGSTNPPAATGCAVIRSLDGEELIGLTAETEKSDFLHVPHVARDTESFFTYSSVVPLADSNQGLGFAGSTGDDFEISPNGSVGTPTVFNYQDLLGSVISNTDYGRVSFAENNRTGMVGAEVFGRNNDRQVVGVGLNQSTFTELYYVHIAQDVDRFWTGLVILNLGNQTANLQINAYDVDGGLIDGGTTETLGPFAGTTPNEPAKKAYLVLGDRQDFGEGAAWLKVTSDQPLIGYELFGNPAGINGSQFAGFEAIGELSQRLAFPHTEEARGGDSFTGLAVVNPGDQIVDLTIRLLNKEGVVKETNTNVSIEAKSKLVRLASGLFQTQIEFGDVILVESTGNIAGFELFGAGTKTMGAIVAKPY